MNSSINKKIIVETSASTFSYDIENRGDIVYSGKAYKAPGNYYIEIDISKKIKDFLGSRMSTAWTETDGVYVCSGAMETFTVLNAEDGSFVDTFTVLNDWSGNWIGQTETLSQPINGRVDPRMKIFWNRASLSAGTEDIERGYDDIDFVILSGDLDFNYLVGTHTLTVSAITDDYTVSSDDSWISVVKSGDTIQVSVAQNTGETRTGSFSVIWNGADFRPRTETITVEQYGEFDMVIEGSLDFNSSAITQTLSFTSNQTPVLLSKPNWVNSVTINGTTAGTITISVSENVETQRTGTIIFSSGDIAGGNNLSFTITQSSGYQVLTFKITKAGYVCVKKVTYGESSASKIKYRLNNGTWKTISGEEMSPLNVSVGDTVSWIGTSGYYGNNTFSGTSRYNVVGHLDSLCSGATKERRVFSSLFTKEGPIDASGLIMPSAITIDNEYQSMFNGCTSLTKAPELPVTTLTDGCYTNMFRNCTSLVQAPSVLPAKTVKTGSYDSMFEGCSKLKKAPDILANSLGVSACYGMFYNCTLLNQIKCLATTRGDDATVYWVYGVAATGTFTKKRGTSWPRNEFGIPAGWTVIEE